MKRIRKLLAGLTALVLSLSLLPTTALAAPQSSYTSESGITVNVTPLPAELAFARHEGEGILVVEKDGVYTFYDVNGNKLGTGSGYKLKGNFNSGLAPVSAYDPYTGKEALGYINKTGALAIPVRFQEAQEFSDGIARVKLGDNLLYIDTTGVGITAQGLLKMSDFQDGIGVATVRNTEGAGPYFSQRTHTVIMDKSGNIVYDFPQRRVEDGVPGAWSMVDTLSRAGAVPDWNLIRQGQIPVEDVDGTAYLMDRTGALRPLPDLKGGRLLAYLGDDRLLVMSENQTMRAIYSMDGTMIMPYLYSYGDLNDTTFDYKIATLRYHGVIDYNGKFVVPEDWSSDSHGIEDFVDGMAVGWEYVGVNRTPYLFWASDSPYGPGATGQKPSTPQPTPTPAPTPAPETPKNLAYASTQTVTVDGKAVEFQMYALKDANGNDTNYVKLRDVASTLNGTPAQFEVSWDGAVNIVTGQPYTPNGSEMSTPFSGDRAYTVPTSETKVNGSAASLESIVLTDDSGNGYTYYKLRDLGTALGFTVDWSAEQGVFIQTN